MSKFKVGDKVRIIEVCDIDEGIFEVGEVVTIIGDAESVSDGILYDIGEYNWCVYENQVEKVEEVEFKVGDKMRVLDFEAYTNDRKYVSLGEELEIIEVDEDGLWFISSQEGTFGEKYNMTPDQVEKVEDVGLKFGVKGFSHMEAPKPYDPIESRIEEMQKRLDQISDELIKLQTEEDDLAECIAVLREAQRIMKEI